jgi:hypothetical protein
MSYKEQILEACMNSLISSGVTEQMITIALLTFEAGFAAGTLMNADDDKKQEMINNLTYIKQVH